MGALSNFGISQPVLMVMEALLRRSQATPGQDGCRCPGWAGRERGQFGWQGWEMGRCPVVKHRECSERLQGWVSHPAGLGEILLGSV